MGEEKRGRTLLAPERVDIKKIKNKGMKTSLSTLSRGGGEGKREAEQGRSSVIITKGVKLQK